MRSERLISILMLLQSHGCMSAEQLADELEVSIRTIYRDMDALGSAGIPVYAELGRYGGYRLIEGYRTSLTGLTRGEKQAISMLNLPSPLANLELSRDLKSALLKLNAALPDGQFIETQSILQRFHLDFGPWNYQDEALPHLTLIELAIKENRKLRITYHTLAGVAISRKVNAYGLVAKAGVWYLVSANKGKIRAHRLSALINVTLMEETFNFPGNFSLVEFWNTWSTNREQRFSAYPVLMRVYPGFISSLPRYFGEKITRKINAAQPDDEDGSLILNVEFESLEAAREQILAFGRGVEVIEPFALRASIADYARQISSRYPDMY